MRLLTILSAVALLTGPSASFADRLDGQRIICPLLYQPVCASRAGVTRTFENACRAEVSGYVVISSGPCGGGSGKGNPFN